MSFGLASTKENRIPYYRTYTEKDPPAEGRAKKAWELFKHFRPSKKIKEMFYSPSCDIGDEKPVRAWVAWYGTLSGMGPAGATAREDYSEIPAHDVTYKHWYFITGPEAEYHTKVMRGGRDKTMTTRDELKKQIDESNKNDLPIALRGYHRAARIYAEGGDRLRQMICLRMAARVASRMA